MIRAGFLFCLWASSAPAQEAGLADRLRALAAPAAPDLYAEDRENDLTLIDSHAEALFDGDAVMVMFTGPDCEECAKSEAALLELSRSQGVRVRILDTRTPEIAALMARLTLDTLPSYVMRDRLIRGDMPVFVLSRYLAE